ncbi:hypothetical protein [Haloarcula litorea]|uniref:hypothetical protein n=1 Tax=Haloarcula litorea TaxID=3032579 RepID=UPI0023E79A66|nr:hypothetical protein [Halomicroarcula sp. GDY20]
MSVRSRTIDRIALSDLVAVAIALAIAAKLRSVSPLPTWLYVGPVTIDTTSLLAIALGSVVAGDWLRRRVDGGADDAASVAVGLLGVLTALAGVYAQVALNTGSGGVFFAAVPALVLAGLTVVAVLARASYRTVVVGRGRGTDS